MCSMCSTFCILKQNFYSKLFAQVCTEKSNRKSIQKTNIFANHKNENKLRRKNIIIIKNLKTQDSRLKR